MIKIDTSPVIYLSQKDEDHFFEWVQQIPCIKSVENGFLHIDTTHISEADLRELIAVMYRYKMPMSQMSELRNISNEHWFADRTQYWYTAVFENQPPTHTS